ncbi:MAG: response regulator [Lachnospiraceae bacterium]|nr:response regulator [Lachnospiraceae bacterium]
MSHKRKSETGKKRISALIILSLLFLMNSMPALAREETPEEPPVRVGFFEFAGYHNQDESGKRSGYGYEYLQQMARYTGWTYEYVGYDKSWSEAQKMLENGEIDILTSAQKTEEREKIFDFSDDPIGYSSTIFTIKAGNDKYTIDDFETFEGIRVGMIEGNSRNKSFDVFAKEKGFSYVPVMFSDNNSLVTALQDESIDAIVTSSLRVTNGEWVVSQFEFSPYYVCVKKGNQELLKQVNDAIGKINQDNPSLQNELENKYYSVDSGGEIAFTGEERRYIADYVSSGKKLKVMINPDRKPLAYYENGELAGIFGEVAKTVLERTGLPYEVIPVSSREEYKAYREQHKVDLCMDMRFDFDWAEKQGYRLTDSYYSATISRVTRRNFEGSVNSIAAITNSDIASEVRNLFYGDAEISYYPTGDQCVQAVRDGEQDAAFLYTYAAERFLDEDITHQLTAAFMPDFTTDFCMGVGDTEDTLLFSIINKSVESIDNNWLDETTTAYTDINNDRVTLMELVYNHPMTAIMAIVIFLILAGAVVLLLVRQSAHRKTEEQSKEIKRLFSYVCSANESVMEINLQAMTKKEYQLEENELRIVESPYKTADNYGQFMNQQDYQDISERLSLEQLDQIIRQGKEYVFEARGKGKSGEKQWYIYTIHGLEPDATHPCNFMLFKRNINELKEKEEEGRTALMDALQVAKEASDAKGSFMSRMSHEIRTPLNAVIGYLTLMKDCLQNAEKINDYITKSQSAARHLLNIINDVLDISAIESGKIKIASEKFDLKELLSTISLMFYNQAKAKDVNFKVEILEMTEELVIGDQLRLNQILMNLLSNAMKFTPAGGNITVTVTQLQANEEEVRFRFVVSDTGIGMSKESMKRIFNPFEQEKAETARKYGGSGLGLSITGNLITMMQGSIEVDSKEGKGTTFTIHLVFKKAPQDTGKNQQGTDLKKIRALIVDDESRSCDYMKALLKRCHVKSDVVLSGEEAIRQILKREGTDYEYDMCLMDWNMPGMNGVETAKQIREKCGKNMPIIIASAYDINEIRDSTLEAGVSRLISKPLFQSSMFDLLVDTFGKYSPDMDPEKVVRKADFTGIRVLLAEDNDMNREIAVSILTKSGLVVDTAVDGKDALDKFIQSEKDTYQLILMDVQMPIMDGYEATRAIRSSTHLQAKSIPILAMTANAFTEDVTAALASGMDDHIAKPVDYDKLSVMLQKYLKES